MSAWSRRNAQSKEDIMIICTLKNESQMSSRAQKSAGTLIQAHPTPTPEIQYVSTVSGANTHKLT